MEQKRFRLDYNFNPRPPWGGRRCRRFLRHKEKGISIHALRGEGDLSVETIRSLKSVISIHALRGEGDDSKNGYTDEEKRFQSTPSVGRATTLDILTTLTPSISIHALRGEGDVNR